MHEVVNAMFSRDSIASLPNGTTVQKDAPRYVDGSILLEKAGQNLFVTASSPAEEDVLLTPDLLYTLQVWGLGEARYNYEYAEEHIDEGSFTHTTIQDSSLTLQPNPALTFNGSSSGVLCTGSGGDYPLGTGPFTISAWIKVTGSSDTYRTILSKSQGTAYKIGVELLVNSENELDIVIGRGLSITSLTSSVVLPTNTWVHVMAIRDAANYLSLYANGTRIAGPYSSEGTDITVPGDLSIGYLAYDNSYYFNGQIREVKIYNVALDDTQIVQDMNDGIVPDLDDNCLGYFPMNEGAGTDIINHSIHGTANGTAIDCSWMPGPYSLSGKRESPPFFCHGEYEKLYLEWDETLNGGTVSCEIAFDEGEYTPITRGSIVNVPAGATVYKYRHTLQTTAEDVTQTPTVSAITHNRYSLPVTENNPATFYVPGLAHFVPTNIDKWMLEQSAYPTSYTQDTRERDICLIPTTAAGHVILDKEQGTIELFARPRESCQLFAGTPWEMSLAGGTAIWGTIQGPYTREWSHIAMTWDTDGERYPESPSLLGPHTYLDVDADANGIADGWYAYTTGDAVGTRNMDDVVITIGRGRSQRIQRTGGSTGRYGIYISLIGITQPNVTSFVVKTEANGGIIKLLADYYNNDGTQWVETISHDINSSTDWHLVSLAPSTNDNIGKVDVCVWIEGGNGTVWVQAVQSENSISATDITQMQAIGSKDLYIDGQHIGTANYTIPEEIPDTIELVSEYTAHIKDLRISSSVRTLEEIQTSFMGNIILDAYTTAYFPLSSSLASMVYHANAWSKPRKRRIVGKAVVDFGTKAPAASFTRNSPAYLDGVQYGANVPRYLPGGGVMVEEGTENLLTANQASVETDLTGFFKRSGNEIHTRVTNEHWHGLASLKVDTPGLVLREGFFFTKTLSASTTYTFSVWLKGAGTVRIEITGGASGNSANINLTPTWTRHSLTFTTTTGENVNMIVCTAGSVQAITFYADGLQLEQKNFATSWHLPGTSRARESLTLPNSGLSPAAGTLAIDVEINEMARRQSHYAQLFEILRADGVNPGVRIRHELGSALWKLVSYADDGSLTLVDIPDASIPDGTRRLWCTIDGAAKVVQLYVDDSPTPVATITDAKLPSAFGNIALGGRSDNTMLNSAIYAARISNYNRDNIELSDATKPMMVDANSVCYVFDGTLSPCSTNTYAGDDIIQLHLLEEKEVSNATLPIGNISSNEIDLKIYNRDRHLDDLARPNNKIEPFIGIVNDDDSIEWHSLGEYWSGDWRIPENDIYAEVSARDKLDALSSSTYETSQVITAGGGETISYTDTTFPGDKVNTTTSIYGLHLTGNYDDISKIWTTQADWQSGTHSGTMADGDDLVPGYTVNMGNNIALSMPVTVSSASFSKHCVNDGDLGSPWVSESGDKHPWAIIDLGTDPPKAARAVLKEIGMDSMTLQCSNNGTSWTNVTSYDDFPLGGATITLDFTARAARYWRVYVSATNSYLGGRAAIYELSLYGINYNTSGTWTSASWDISSAVSYGYSLVQWTADVPIGCSLTIESKLSDGDWQPCVNGGPIAGLTPGQSLSGKSVQLRAILGGTTIECVVLHDLSLTILPARKASGSFTSASMNIEAAGTSSGGYLSMDAEIPPGTSISLEVSIDGGTTWISQTANASIPVLEGLDCAGRSIRYRASLTSSNGAMAYIRSIGIEVYPIWPSVYTALVDILEDTGLSIDYVDPSLKQTRMPVIWMPKTSHREALRLCAEAALAQVYMGRDGLLHIEGPGHLAASPVRGMIDWDEIYSKDNPVKLTTIANVIEVPYSSWNIPNNPTEVYKIRDTEPIQIGANEEKVVTVSFSKVPVIEASTTLYYRNPDDISIIDERWYTWGGYVTVKGGSTAGEFALSVDGKVLEQSSETVITVQDDESIAANGRRVYRFPSNHLIQTPAAAEAIASSLLETYKDPRRDLTMTWRGDLNLTLGDKIRVPYHGGTTRDFYITKQDISFDGSLTVSMEGKTHG